MKEKYLNSPIGRLRAIGFVEGISFIVLLGIAMPLKYMADMPLAVKYVGWAHGLLFIMYIAAVGQVTFTRRWSFSKALMALGASIIPFGPFIIDGRLRREQEA